MERVNCTIWARSSRPKRLASTTLTSTHGAETTILNSIRLLLRWTSNRTSSTVCPASWSRSRMWPRLSTTTPCKWTTRSSSNGKHRCNMKSAVIWTILSAVQICWLRIVKVWMETWPMSFRVQRSKPGTLSTRDWHSSRSSKTTWILSWNPSQQIRSRKRLKI